MKTKLLTGLLLICAICAHSQAYNIVTNLYNSGTLTNATTNAGCLTTNMLDVRQYRTVGLVAGFSGQAADTNGVARIWVSSMYDYYGSNYLTSTNHCFIVPLNGLSRVVISTNFDVAGMSYVQPTRIEFSGTNNATNFFLWGIQKGYLRDR